MTEVGKALRDRSFKFALRMIKLAQFLEKENGDRVLSRQVLRSGTSIGANIRESRFAQSRADFIAKLQISLKEAEETSYWLELLQAAEAITERQFTSLKKDLDWLIATLVKSLKTAKGHESSK